MLYYFTESSQPPYKVHYCFADEDIEAQREIYSVLHMSLGGGAEGQRGTGGACVGLSPEAAQGQPCER